MRFDVVTLFPELFASHLTHGVTQRAYGSGLVDVRLWPLRDFAEGNYRRVDDRPFGGGPGMVLMAKPLLRAVDAIWLDRGASCAVLYFTPSGAPMTQALIHEFASGEGAVLICGRYEGVDQRFIDARVTHRISLGDFVLSGGELPALALLDAVARLQAGVLSEGSASAESFADGLLEGPCYSRPERLDIDDSSVSVPVELLSGNHALLRGYHRQQALLTTARTRPDLLAVARAQGRLTAEDERYLAIVGL